MDSLAALPLIREAFRFIDDFDHQTVQNQISLNEIPAPPFMEGLRAEKYAQMMRGTGLQNVEVDREGNVIGYRPGTDGDRTIVLSAHLDTVFPEGTNVTVEVRNDTLFAPGISDDARGLTSVLTILKTMQELNIRTSHDLLFIGTVGEEGIGDLRGVKYLFREGGPDIDTFISIDGSNAETITSRALGSHRYRITFEGPGGHSWGAFGRANPAHALGRAIYHFDERASGFVGQGSRTSYNVGRIGGGTSVNSIPYSNWMEVDLRSVDQDRLRQIDDILQETVKTALNEANDSRGSGDPLTVDIKMIGNRPSGETDSANPFIQRSIAATRQFGNEPVLQRSSTDSNIPISLGIPSATLGGGGDSGNTHSLDEWWVNDAGARGIQRVFLILMGEAGLSR
ncbi:MAG: M20/M25/M40 family metallo-hydrolase [Balneolaceae bacterium]